MQIKLFYIYALELIGKKYYIGKTTRDVFSRYTEHKKGVGAQWTKIHKPIKMIEFFETTDKFDEDKYTKKYMEKYGIENVRGGTYSKIYLDEYQLKILELEFRTANNLCFKCGSSKHYTSKCMNL